MPTRVSGAKQAEQTTAAVVSWPQGAVGEHGARPGRPAVAPGGQRKQGPARSRCGLAGGQVVEPWGVLMVAVPPDHAVGEQGAQACLEDVAAMPTAWHIVTAAGTLRADTQAARLLPQAWQKLPAGAGAKGHRYYDWAWVAIEPGRAGHRHLLVRRSRRTRELAYYRCYAPGPVSLARLVHIAGLRWTAEEDFAASKALAGLDEHQVRRWISWYRWVTLAMLALALLTVAAAAEHTRDPRPAGQVPLTRNEIARLLTLAVPPATGTGYRLRWSAWRRRHQHKARASHYERQAAHDP